MTEYCVLPIGSDDIHCSLDPDKNIKSILFYGPRGTGKTLAVEAVTHELGGLLIHLTPGDTHHTSYYIISISPLLSLREYFPSPFFSLLYLFFLLIYYLSFCFISFLLISLSFSVLSTFSCTHTIPHYKFNFLLVLSILSFHIYLFLVSSSFLSFHFIFFLLSSHLVPPYLLTSFLHSFFLPYPY